MTGRQNFTLPALGLAALGLAALEGRDDYARQITFQAGATCSAITKGSHKYVIGKFKADATNEVIMENFLGNNGYGTSKGGNINAIVLAARK